MTLVVDAAAVVVLVEEVSGEVADVVLSDTDVDATECVELVSIVDVEELVFPTESVVVVPNCVDEVSGVEDVVVPTDEDVDAIAGDVLVAALDVGELVESDTVELVSMPVVARAVVVESATFGVLVTGGVVAAVVVVVVPDSVEEVSGVAVELVLSDKGVDAIVDVVLVAIVDVEELVFPTESVVVVSD